MLLENKYSVSVVISTSNRLRLLQQSVRSVFSQSVPPAELIIIDDFSVDEVKERDLPDRPSGTNLIIIRNPSNLGGARSLNIGISIARSPIIAFLDDDDFFLPNYLKELHAEWNLVGEDVVCVASSFYWCTNELTPYRRSKTSGPVTHNDLLMKGNLIGGSSVISVRRDTCIKIGGYPHIGGSHDWGLLLRLAAVGAIMRINKPLVLYRSPTTNLNSNYTRRFRSQILAVGRLYRMQSPENRLVMHRCLRESHLIHLIRWGRRRMAFRIWRYNIATTDHIGKRHIMFLMLIIVGPSAYNRTLFILAKWRAFLLGFMLRRTSKIS